MSGWIWTAVVSLAASFALVGTSVREGRAEHGMEEHGIEVVATGVRFPEGPIFIGSTLYFVDYAASDVLRLVDGKLEEVWHGDGCGANGLAALQGRLFVACYDSGSIIAISTEGKTLETIDHDATGDRFVKPNDLATDAGGGLYFTGSGDGSTPGKVYYRAPAGEVSQVAEGIAYANGIAVSKDGRTLYVVESDAHRVLTFAIGRKGSLSEERILVDLQRMLGEGGKQKVIPDGLRLDGNGRLFVGLYDGGGFAVLTGGGQLIRKVVLPGRYHASLAISPDGKEVFVTAADEASGGQVLRVHNPLAD